MLRLSGIGEHHFLTIRLVISVLVGEHENIG